MTPSPSTTQGEAAQPTPGDVLIIVRDPFVRLLSDGVKVLELRGHPPPAPVQRLMGTTTPLFFADKAVAGRSHVRGSARLVGSVEIRDEAAWRAARAEHRVDGTRASFMRMLGYTRLFGWCMERGTAAPCAPPVRRIVRSGPVVWDRFQPFKPTRI